MSITNLSAATRRPAGKILARLAARIHAGVVLVTFLAVPAFAQTVVAKDAAAVAEKKVVAVVLTQSKVVKAADGTEQLQDAASVKPGDIVEYKATYTNNTGKAVTGLVANLPIPEGLEYLPKSAKPGAALVKAAAKDGVFAAEPLTHIVAGKTEPVAYGDYRSLRWTLGQLPANGVTAVSARAKVQIVVPPAPKTSAAAPQAPPVAVQPAASGTPR
ncbi:putative repeat protein (TIGR01451 family) [Variovorax sp. GrIS 2.14]|uniref:hypothetical protein n=1 Tax=Variovorax sp. GrIS 2.14 TaxID=3071709 RepID=UPI0038F6314D